MKRKLISCCAAAFLALIMQTVQGSEPGQGDRSCGDALTILLAPPELRGGDTTELREYINRCNSGVADTCDQASEKYEQQLHRKSPFTCKPDTDVACLHMESFRRGESPYDTEDELKSYARQCSKDRAQCLNLRLSFKDDNKSIPAELTCDGRY